MMITMLIMIIITNMIIVIIILKRKRQKLMVWEGSDSSGRCSNAGDNFMFLSSYSYPSYSFPYSS